MMDLESILTVARVMTLLSWLELGSPGARTPGGPACLCKLNSGNTRTMTISKIGAGKKRPGRPATGRDPVTARAKAKRLIASEGPGSR